MEAVAGCNYLYRRGGTYWFRRRVPDDVLDTLGRSAWRESLHTKDFEQAKQAARRRGVETDRLIAAQAMAATWLEAVLADEEDIRVGLGEAGHAASETWLFEDEAAYRPSTV
jgi:hypothetical protein